MIKQISTLLLVAGLVACTSTSYDAYTGEQEVNRAAVGAGIGALSGAIVGAIAGDDKAALIGAAAGTIAGASIATYMDNQEKELRKNLKGTGVRVQHVGDHINLVMPSDITFKFDSDDINAHFYPVLKSVGSVLNKYDKTVVEVSGYTDITGSKEYNQKLSERRAQSVVSFLETHGVFPHRLLMVGHGIDKPVASNDTSKGRAKNRRVEIQLRAQS